MESSVWPSDSPFEYETISSNVRIGWSSIIPHVKMMLFRSGRTGSIVGIVARGVIKIIRGPIRIQRGQHEHKQRPFPARAREVDEEQDRQHARGARRKTADEARPIHVAQVQAIPETTPSLARVDKRASSMSFGNYAPSTSCPGFRANGLTAAVEGSVVAYEDGGNKALAVRTVVSIHFYGRGKRLQLPFREHV